ncbi:MAG: DCC1-like thiol-disulfide oxidoreductase family protein [Erythrobacter sp.]
MKSASTDTPRVDGPWVLYDGECPFCSAYVKMVRLQDAVGKVRLVDAREGGPELAEVRAAGYNIDEGMVLKYDGVLHHGDECIHVLSLMTTRSGLLNRLNAWVFRSRRRSQLLYPVLKGGRNAALSLMGRTKIEEQRAAGHSN